MVVAKAQKHHVTPGKASEKSKKSRKTENITIDRRQWWHIMQKLTNKTSKEKRTKDLNNKKIR